MARRFGLFSTNVFRFLGEGATLRGCNADNMALLHEVCLNRDLVGAEPWVNSRQLHDADDTTENELDAINDIIDRSIDGDTVLFAWSKHGTHAIDTITGQKCSALVSFDSDWNADGSFITKQMLQRAFANLKPGVKVYCWIDCCESGHFGEEFRLVDNPRIRNRWITPPLEIALLPFHPTMRSLGAQKQVQTMAGCVETGTCADIQGAKPHGLFTRSGIDTFKASPNAAWSMLSESINQTMSAGGESQRCVPDGGERPFLS